MFQVYKTFVRIKHNYMTSVCNGSDWQQILGQAWHIHNLINLLYFRRGYKFDLLFLLKMWVWPSTNFTCLTSTTFSKSSRLLFYLVMCFDALEYKNQGFPLLLSIFNEVIVISHKFVFSSLNSFLQINHFFGLSFDAFLGCRCYLLWPHRAFPSPMSHFSIIVTLPRFQLSWTMPIVGLIQFLKF